MTRGSVRELGFGTRQVHAGEVFDPVHQARITPIYLTAGYLFDDLEQGRARFAGEEQAYVYSRLSNPTNAVAEARLASLDSGVAALVVGSGQAAIAMAVLSLVSAGDHVLVAPSIYEGTRTLFRTDLARLGVEFEFVDDHNDPADWAKRVRPNTRFFFAETIPNPKNELLDIRAVADAAHAAGVPLVVDNTIATPYLVRPIEHGADIVVYSTSKFLTGHGASIGGAVIDGGRFDWAAHADRFPQFSAPVRGDEGPSFVDRFGEAAFLAYARKGPSASFGPSLSPLHSFLLLQGVETLSLRMEKHVTNALTLARWLESRPEVESVDYGGLETSPYHDLARRYLPRGAGAVFAFTLRGGREAAEALIDAVQLFSVMTHIGDVRSLILHPPTTTHARLSQEERSAAGIAPGLIRLSVGIEDVDDLLDDLEQGFAAIGAPPIQDALLADGSGQRVP
jgi:O-acetylhomoserine (thiol)-lyase